MSKSILIATILALFLVAGSLWANTHDQEAMKLDKTAAIAGTVVFTDGKRQQNVYGKCVNLHTFNTYYVPGTGKVRSPIDDELYFGREWHAEESGSFELLLPPGVYKLWAFGAKSKAVTLTVRQGAHDVAVKVIGRTDNLIAPFLFETPDGRPLADATVGMGGGGIATDRQGVGGIKPLGGDDPTLPMNLMFWVRGVGFATAIIKNEDDLLRTKPPLVRLQRGSLVIGSAVSKTTGVPLGGVRIFPVRDYRKDDKWGDWNSLLGDSVREHTVSSVGATNTHDGDGRFTIGPLPPGHYHLWCTFPRGETNSFNTLRVVPLHIVEGGADKLLKIKIPLLEPMGAVKGRIMTPNRLPVRNAEVIIYVRPFYPPDDDFFDRDEHWYVWAPLEHHVKTDGIGEFTLYPLYLGKHTLEVRQNDLLVEHTVTVPSSEKLNFVLKKPDMTR